ncbi:MAG: barstar family protein [Oscillospiraceae bacterium]|nr:barstar family protein [Oscillospiraceae bacterium]
MKEILLDGSELESMEEIHLLFKEKLELPEYYGFNLDALYDVLTEQTEDVMIIVRSRTQLSRTLGRRYARLMRMLHEAAEENGHITPVFEQ